MSVSPLLLNAPPLLDLKARDERGAIIETLGLVKGNADIIDFSGFQAAVFERQKINPPVLGCGVAMPHARTPLVKELIFAAARCREEVAFGDEQSPVRLIFLFGVPPHRISQYLAAMAALVRRLRSSKVMEGLLAAETVDEFQGWLAE